ncbi:hypothetical protein J6590_016330 [Homalodisca vitripennis]|nr:hypothetical protein J6590_016330 [Homalodisca vitripennis]
MGVNPRPMKYDASSTEAPVDYSTKISILPTIIPRRGKGGSMRLNGSADFPTRPSAAHKPTQSTPSLNSHHIYCTTPVV